jgi:molybdopterin-guanine dinucleotide biosynthesis protein A
MTTGCEAPRACAGVVLAGGGSTRMGRDKALLEYRGRTLLDHMLDVLHAAGFTPCLVSGSYPSRLCVPDAHPGRGPVSGLLSVAKALPSQRLVIVAVDMPHLDRALLQRLANEAPDARCVRFAGCELPLRIDATRETLVALSTIFDREGRARSLRAAEASVDVIELSLSVQEAAQLINCNTPSQWATALGVLT